MNNSSKAKKSDDFLEIIDQLQAINEQLAEELNATDDYAKLDLKKLEDLSQQQETFMQQLAAPEFTAFHIEYNEMLKALVDDCRDIETVLAQTLAK